MILAYLTKGQEIGTYSDTEDRDLFPISHFHPHSHCYNLKNKIFSVLLTPWSWSPRRGMAEWVSYSSPPSAYCYWNLSFWGTKASHLHYVQVSLFTVPCLKHRNICYIRKMLRKVLQVVWTQATVPFIAINLENYF